jgi:cell filamentation protein
MYDAIDDPYDNSTVLVNKLDLRDQDDLDDYEAEISNARSEEPLPEGELDFSHYCAVHHHAPSIHHLPWVVFSDSN